MFTNLNKELAAAVKFVPTAQEVELLNRAVSEACKSMQRFAVGAADNSGRRGYNTPTLHAEINMLGGLEPIGSPTSVAVARLGRDGKWRCSYPCANCHAALKVAGYRRLVCFNESGQPVALTL